MQPKESWSKELQKKKYMENKNYEHHIKVKTETSRSFCCNLKYYISKQELDIERDALSYPSLMLWLCWTLTALWLLSKNTEWRKIKQNTSIVTVHKKTPFGGVESSYEYHVFIKMEDYKLLKQRTKEMSTDGSNRYLISLSTSSKWPFICSSKLTILDSA